MDNFRKVLIGCAAASLIGVGMPIAALADPPGPGDKQCIPGLNSQPKPGQKGGSCDKK